jgi:hypothetical protein
MAMLHPLFSALVRELPSLPIEPDEAEALEAIHARRRADIARYAVDLLGEGMGDFLVAHGVDAAAIPKPLEVATLKNDEGFRAVLAGTRAVGHGERDLGLVTLIQRAFQAALARSSEALPREMGLPRFGADGDFGTETMVALSAFRRHVDPNAVPVVGDEAPFSADDASRLVAILEAAGAPPLLSTGRAPQPLSGKGAARIAKAAEEICNAAKNTPFRVRVDGRVYEYWAALFGTNPNHRGAIRAPHGIVYWVRPEVVYWKCNIFGGCVMAVAEVPVPSFRVGSSSDRHFPRAEDFGAKLAKKAGWKLVHHLDHRDPADPTQARWGENEEAELRELLRDARPGDLYFVDHPGEPRDGGGHTRVCVAAAEDGDPQFAPAFAQAREDAAHVLRNGLNHVGNGSELQHWLVRYTG